MCFSRLREMCRVQRVLQTPVSSEPRRVVADKLHSYGVAHRALIPDATHNNTRHFNNRPDPARVPPGRVFTYIRAMPPKKNKLTEIARRMMSGVVQIHVEGHIEEDIESVMNPAIKLQANWSGSGFFVKYKDLEGYIVTNAHVVRNAVKIEISSMLTSEERFQAELVGLVKMLEPDVALIRLSGSELLRFKSLAIQEIESLELMAGRNPVRGEEIKAIGYPLGMAEPNITGGEITNFVSGSEHTTERFVTNAAINPGNSGGPSVNDDGKVVGLNTAVITGAENIGFITPSSFVKIIIDNLLKKNEPYFSGIGGMLQKNAKNFNPLLNQHQAKGVIVSRVVEGGFLSAANIQARDVILAINGVEFDRHGIVIGKEGLHRHRNIYDMIKLVPIGESVVIIYQRDGEIRKNSAIAKRNPDRGIVSNPIISERRYLEVFGMVVQPLSYDIMEAMHGVDTVAQIEMVQMIDENVPVLTVTHIHQGTQADEMEWPRGELIVKANDKNVFTLEDLQAVLGERNSSGYVLLECRNGRIGYFKLDAESADSTEGKSDK